MKPRLLRLLSVAFLLLFLSSYAPHTAGTTYAQCSCTCTGICPSGCDFHCEGCGLTDWIRIAAGCCAGALAGIQCQD